MNNCAELTFQSMSNNTKFLLHACCGPCSLEPVRLLRERGIEPVIFFSNSNIAPIEEYEKRRDTIKNWCNKNNVTFIEDDYAPNSWEEAVEGLKAKKPERCRQCYRSRFERTAKFATENGFEGIGTTLTISPYQYAQTIKEELLKACEKVGLKCFYEDYSSHFREAQRRAKEEGLYRQHYCGCLPSKAEAEAEKLSKAKIKKENTKVREIELQKKRDAKKVYAEKRAKQREILKNLRKEKNVD
jgi:epoxyqueuosine reductase